MNMGSVWGKNLKISVFGESHGPQIGVVIDGFPAGFSVNMEEILSDMSRRAPGKSNLTTGRKEADFPNIVSGLLDGVTTGAPICMVITNQDTKSQDYKNLQEMPRPSHSDFTGAVRYAGYNDLRGGGHFSGRLTAPLVFAGALCKSYLLAQYGIHIKTNIYSIGQYINKEQGDCIDDEIKNRIEEVKTEGDSIGGVIDCVVEGVYAGVGNPIFDNVESRIASIVYSIPGVKGVEFGDGFSLAQKKG